MANPIVLKESIMIVGSEMHYTNPANKLMFAGQAVRGLRVYLDKQSAATILMYRVGYTQGQMDAVKNAAQNVRPGSKFVEIASDEELINYINTGSKSAIGTAFVNIRTKPDKANQVTKIDRIFSFSHGVTNYLTFKLTNAELSTASYEDEFGVADVSKLKAESFAEGAIFYSNACRTGVGTSGENITAQGLHPEKSIAQVIANTTKTKVIAWGSRTDYTNTWGTRQERRNYSYDWITTDPPNAARFNKWRAKEVTVDGALWNPDGAYNGVAAGTTPVGGSFKQITFMPQKINIPTKKPK
jgi:hypothetical protein